MAVKRHLSWEVPVQHAATRAPVPGYRCARHWRSARSGGCGETRQAELQTLGGWRSLDMVQRYAHLAPDFIASYAENSARSGVQKGVQQSGASLKLVATA